MSLGAASEARYLSSVRPLSDRHLCGLTEDTPRLRAARASEAAPGDIQADPSWVDGRSEGSRRTSVSPHWRLSTFENRGCLQEDW